MQRVGPAVAALKKLLVGEAAVAINYGFAVAIEAAGTAGEVEGREGRFHVRLAIIEEGVLAWR
ncbi:MAG: hypothetical protein ACKVJU_24640 [Verrucomicrobiales bacterium]